MVFYDSGGLIGPHVDYHEKSQPVQSLWMPKVLKQFIHRMIFVREICRQSDEGMIQMLICRLSAAIGLRSLPKMRNPEDFTGPRAVTLLVCLIEDQGGGGATLFPALNIRIKLKPGDVLIYLNMLEKGVRDCRTLHIGCPVIKEKRMAHLWIADFEMNIFKQKFVNYFASVPQFKPYEMWC